MTLSFRLGVSCAVGAALLWGLGTIASAAELDRGIPSGSFTFVELFGSVVFLAVVARLTRTALPSWRSHWRVGILGVLEPGLTYYLANAGLARTSVTHAAVIAALEPVIVAILGWLVLSNALRARVLLPMMAILAGTAAVVTAHSSNGGASWTGDALIAAGVLCAAFYVIGSSRIDPDLPALGVILLQQLFALGLVIPLSGISLVTDGGFHEHVVGASPMLLWLAVPFIGVGVFSLTFWLFLIALRHIAAGTAAQFLSLSTLVGFLGAVVLLGEKTSWQAIFGAAIVVASLVAIARGEAGAAHSVDI